MSPVAPSHRPACYSALQRSIGREVLSDLRRGPATGIRNRRSTTRRGVTCTATDASGNTGNGSFAVTVVDTLASLLAVPANIPDDDGRRAATVSVTYVASATDLGQSLLVVCTSSAGVANVFPATQSFAIGTTVVSCSTTDGDGRMTGQATAGARLQLK